MASDTEERQRSRSSPREDSRPKKPKSGGFKWKAKRPAADADKASSDDRSLRRGYRDRSPRRDNYTRRDRDREDDRDRDRNRDRDRSPRRRDREGGDGYRPSRDDARKNDDPLDRVSSSARDRPAASSEKTEKKDKPKKAPKHAAPSEPMIIVNVNDRLGTKAAIPCLASDSVKAFKAIVAAHVGRQPHEIMLKRQGERPFKDILTLADYGVSSGVQLDLEIDTGD
ncbi:hypothetical protein WHR41_05513 [Cladosporium halotolerans]|uniref:Ubiquitin-like modifier HUB1 n=1 Tax=Cladosporium halotolerans TaxID=1052096 RepID=A0AB34KMV6_9PEZI